MVASPPGTSFFCTRLMVGFGGFSIETPFIINGAQGVLDLGTITVPYRGACTMGAPIFTLVAFCGIGIFSSSMTLLHNINLFYQYLASSGVDTTYDLGVLSTGVDISVAGCHRLIFGAFCSHTGCWIWEW